jgi:3-oxoacyl-[acyl-carrier protein] reductase
MQERGYGRIVNLTSIGIHTGGYSLTSAVYEATKGAIHNFTKTLARSLAPHGILVNSVAPGGMLTRMLLDETPPEVLAGVMADIPVRRLAEPAEVAEVVAFLASDRNTYASGASFDVNGGAAMA